jgi:hypothetical protein
MLIESLLDTSLQAAFRWLVLKNDETCNRENFGAKNQTGDTTNDS